MLQNQILEFIQLGVRSNYDLFTCFVCLLICFYVCMLLLRNYFINQKTSSSDSDKDNYNEVKIKKIICK